MTEDLDLKWKVVENTLADLIPLAEQGMSTAQYILGTMYGNGQGVPQNNEIALKWFTLAADQGNSSAQNCLGAIYADGRGIRKNEETAVNWYRKSAEQGYDWGQFKLARMYQDGEGVLTNYVRAYMWYELTLYTSPKSDFAFHAKELKQLTAQKMTKADISSAQEMASRCLKSGYSDC